MAEGGGHLTHEQKRAVARALMSRAGDLVEFWNEHFEGLGEEPPCTAEEARTCIARWLKSLPGDEWDIRLGQA